MMLNYYVKEMMERPDQNSKTVYSSELKRKLNAWVLERLIGWTPKLLETKSRWLVAKAVIKDLNHQSISPQMVLTSTRAQVETLTRLKVVPNSPLILSSQDSRHPEEEFQTEFHRYHESRCWMAQETGGKGVISQAIIWDTGQTMLTINPTQERFKNANPRIIRAQNLPLATVTMFNLLVESIPQD